jgi:hypothetical protein
MRFVCFIVVAMSMAPAGLAQSKKATVTPAPAPKTAAKPANKPAAPVRGPVGAEQLERLLNMTPEQRQKALSQLPPGRRQQLHTRLDNLDSLPADRRTKQLDQLKRLESLSPQRQQAVRQEFQNINAMTFKERRERLHSDEFNQTYTPEEQQLIRDRFANAAK